jgi:hypothetical protein
MPMGFPHGFLPSTDEGLLAWGANCSTLMSATPAAFGLTEGDAALFAAKQSAFADALQAAADLNGRTREKIAAKHAARFALRRAASDLSKIVQGTPTVTDQQKIDLGLNVEVLPVPIPTPAFAPKVETVLMDGHTWRLRLDDAATIHRRARPAGAKEAVRDASVFSFVGASPPTRVSTWKFEGSTTETLFGIVFPDDLAPGTTVWATVFWFNPASQSWSASDPVSEVIRSGEMSMAA